MGTPLQLHRTATDHNTYTAADLIAELDPSPEAIVKHATADVENDIGLLGVKPGDLPAGMVRRLVGLKSVWRRLVLDGSSGSLSVGSEYSRLLDEIDMFAELNLRDARDMSIPAKPRRGKGR